MQSVAKRILWVDDEVALLQPHLLFLRQRGYHVDTITNGDDALALMRQHPYDLVLLDEQMPGRRGLEVLAEMRRDLPHARVVMLTKAEDDRTLIEAVGRQVDEYLIKPASPRQVLSVVMRLVEGGQIRQQRAAQDFAVRFPELSRLRDMARSWDDYAALFSELVDWDLRLEEAGERGLADSVGALLIDLRREFGTFLGREYRRWVAEDTQPAARPPLSVDVVSRWLLPHLGAGPVLFIIIDCMRLDQWRAIRPLLADDWDLSESLHCSILPTATPYSRNAIFGGVFADQIAQARPEWWETDEGSRNAFEDELLREQLRRLTGRNIPVHYEKVFTDIEADELVARVRGALRRNQESVVSVIFNFVDLLTHGRSESAILMEVARDATALRALTRQWFAGSSVLRILREAAALRIPVVLTSDHGSILCQRPVTVYARRDVTSNLRYKFGQDLRAADRDLVLSFNDERGLRMPPGKLATNYLLALEDSFFVYPTKLREYQARYRGSFLHGGASPEEMILPVATLTPRSSTP